MNNYVYIISCLPVLSQDVTAADGLDADSILEEIRSQCSPADNALIDMLTEGMKPENISKDLYVRAAASRNSFIRDFFDLDLNMRNAKATYLNKAFGRPEGQDTIILDEESQEQFDKAAEVDAILSKEDLIAREKGLDDFIWKEIDEMVAFKYFDIDVILAFIAKLKIIDRWLKLDEKTGREMFRKLVGDVRSTFKGVEFES